MEKSSAYNGSRMDWLLLICINVLQGLKLKLGGKNKT